MNEPAVLTRVFKRHAAYYVQGHAKVDGQWRKASFVMAAQDVEAMSRADFEAFALRNLPEMIEGKNWEAQAV